MTSRHTISHADELYRGNAYEDGYSPDGRRGTLMTNLHLHKFLSTCGVPAVAGDVDGIFSSYQTLSLLAADGTNWISLATGALVSAGSTVISLDVPRNIVMTTSGSTMIKVKFHGRDVYGNAMAETIIVSGGDGDSSGHKLFKEIDKIYATAAFATDGAITMSMGTGNHLGVPFHLQTTDQVVAVTVDGKTVTSGSTGLYSINIGASSATTLSTANKTADARGDIQFLNPVPDGSKRLAVLLEVDSSTRRLAFGPPQISSCTNG
jgi:hypothetical protein